MSPGHDWVRPKPWRAATQKTIWTCSKCGRVRVSAKAPSPYDEIGMTCEDILASSTIRLVHES
ncbi:MAG: hypothetical protein BWY99_02633 [Synergistetes bacterium ADurb.BinA166]|nr:MAG: hypothetical protein BWY99_02633 [Synergistetes bacterium ADurb.BinA166]